MLKLRPRRGGAEGAGLLALAGTDHRCWIAFINARVLGLVRTAAQDRVLPLAQLRWLSAKYPKRELISVRLGSALAQVND